MQDLPQVVYYQATFCILFSTHYGWVHKGVLVYCILHTVRYTLNAILFKAGHYGQKHCFIMHRSILRFVIFCFHNMWKELEIIINMLLSIYCITMYLHIQIMFNFLKMKKSIFSCTEPEMSTSAALASTKLNRYSEGFFREFVHFYFAWFIQLYA